ncbi:MAG: phosphoribosylanthranilate isomerase [Lacrimispora sp.]|uniref:phosphoribosylanthranilate isomerase n=1 Tax=Lacrimispora sp. TaxID=2719234 RepID=UPI0039E2A344
MSRKKNRIKICGLTRREDILAVNTWKPDYIGFVFAPGKRQVTALKAKELKELLLPEIPAVGVFVNSPMEDVLALAEQKTIDCVQLHGDEDCNYILELKKHLGPGVPIIKAIRVQTEADIIQAGELPADFLLFDTYTKGVYGGSGKTFDWSMIPAIKTAQGASSLPWGQIHRKPWFLAGGIDASNIRLAMETDAFCLDLSSSLETEGKKDPEKIREIIQIIRSKE